MLSSFQPPGGGTQTRKPDGVGILGLWPALCILTGLSGCYFGPINPIEEDMPPVFISSNKEPVNATMVIEQSTNVFVIMSDEDPETLRYEWVLSEDGWVENAKTVSPGATQVFLEADPDLDGQRLTLTAIDREQQYTSVFWQLEVLR